MLKVPIKVFAIFFGLYFYVFICLYRGVFKIYCLFFSIKLSKWFHTLLTSCEYYVEKDVFLQKIYNYACL